jgi:hypothetical protein
MSKSVKDSNSNCENNNSNRTSLDTSSNTAEPFKFLSFMFDEELVMEKLCSQSDEEIEALNNNTIDDENETRQSHNLEKRNQFSTSTNINQLTKDLDSNLSLKTTHQNNNFACKNSIEDDVQENDHFETSIIKNETLCIQNSILENYDNLVESPYNKREEIQHKSYTLRPRPIEINYTLGFTSTNHHHHNHNHHQHGNNNQNCSITSVNPSNKTASKSILIDYLNKLNIRELNAHLKIQDEDDNCVYNDESSQDDLKKLDGFLYKPNVNDLNVDTKIKNLRNKLFMLIMTHLENTLKSETMLKEFRESFIRFLKNYDLNNSSSTANIEQFGNEAFQYFNTNLFCKLLSSVNIEWSHRLKS